MNIGLSGGAQQRPAGTGSGEGRRPRLRTSLLLTAVGAGLVAISAFGILQPHPAAAPTALVRAPATIAPAPDALQTSITKAQSQLRSEPGDWGAWATLGSAYVQEARITADPSYYPKAEGALNHSLQLRPEGNVTAMVGMAALTSARHEFTVSLEWGMRAEAAAPSAAAVYGVIDDALTQLGRYPEARAAAQHMLDLAPSISSFARASYDLEEHGDVVGATAALQRALVDAFTPADVAFCRYYLGELAFNSGRLSEAMHQYQLGRQADAAYFPLLEGVAKVEAAIGQVPAALRDYNELLARVPLPQYVNELLDYEQSLGRTHDAAAQRSLFDTEAQLFTANGVDVDLEAAILDADHGDPAAAVRHAQLEWSRRHSVLVADALAWALHAAGRNSEALGYANQALSLGWRNALLHFHRGMIEAALRMPAAARSDLAAAEAINPYFSTLWGGQAQRTLASLGGAP
ncbi:MAG: tetratricopeptide repeat protein [Candidatus Dormibacteraeota bacterium]|nr:tetratricopeptide repeat protein [Candidatus Dormibacteraeota bacterium]